MEDLAKPFRVQMSRRKGWRMPPSTVYVGRPGRFGNPFSVAEHGRDRALDLFEAWIEQNQPLLADARRTLRGRNLACWCAPGQRCHADVLLRLVNRDEADFSN